MFLSIFLFFARGGWLPSDIRLDTGDPPGTSRSVVPQISCSGTNVYAVWQDERNGYYRDIYFNYSADGGTTWLPEAYRLDTGDPPGANSSQEAKITCFGDNVYVVWEDARNGYADDIYFNYSTDKGATWQASDIRLDTGDTPGANWSYYPQISCSPTHVYVVWHDSRNGSFDIYFNYSSDGGANWQASAMRLDVGDGPGANLSMHPQISSCGSNVYVVWEDSRNGLRDIYFNYSTDNGLTWQATDTRLDMGDTPGSNTSYDLGISSNGSNVYAVWVDQRNSSTDDIYFNYSSDGGANWQASDIRLDTGDQPGTNYSGYPQISSSGSNVYVVWSDSRNGERDIYFNYSTDEGATWQATDIRLDTGDMPGADQSMGPQIRSSGSNVYVVWEDARNGRDDIYFNNSTSGGKTWKTPAVRLDTGDSPGANYSEYPQIACLESDIYVVWHDWRNGEMDIYFNTATLPVPDIKTNGSDGPITITCTDTLSITVEFDAGSFSGDEADWWLVARTPFGWYYYDKSAGWLPGREVTLQITLRDLPLREVLNMSGLPAGNYTFYFGVDMVKNGLIDIGQAYYDQVKVTIIP
jgi:hypothetical protein